MTAIDWIIWNLDAEQFLSEEHSFPLVPGLTPVVNIENVKSELLGSPFTACVDHKLEPDYSVSGCRYRQVDFQDSRVYHEQFLKSICWKIDNSLQNLA